MMDRLSAGLGAVAPLPLNYLGLGGFPAGSGPNDLTADLAQQCQYAPHHTVVGAQRAAGGLGVGSLSPGQLADGDFAAAQLRATQAIRQIAGLM
jgi:hypothetical protein